MDAINPNDIAKLNKDEISFITLKNGKMVMVDESAPEKYISNKINDEKNYQNKKLNIDKKTQNFSISKKITYLFEGNDINNNLNSGKLNSKHSFINQPKILKNNFNLISFISKNTNFSYKNNSNKKVTNNIPNLKMKNIIKEKEMNINNDLNELDNVNTSNISNLANQKKDELAMEEKLGMNCKTKSRNINNDLFEEKYNQKFNSVASLKITADLNKYFSKTQQTFNSLLTQLKQKKIKYSMNPKDKNRYLKYYELYKNKGKDNEKLKNINFNKIQYYQEENNNNEDSNKNNNDILGKNKFNKNILNIFNSKYHSTFYRNVNQDLFGENDSVRTSLNSFYWNRTSASSKNIITNSKLSKGSIGYSSTLICPSNIFKTNL